MPAMLQYSTQVECISLDTRYCSRMYALSRFGGFALRTHRRRRCRLPVALASVRSLAPPGWGNMSTRGTTTSSDSRQQKRLRVLSTHVSQTHCCVNPWVSSTAAEALYAPMTAASLGGELQQLCDSSGILGDTAALRLRLAEDGYLFLPGFHERAAVMEGRRELLEHLASCDDDPEHPIFKPGTALDDAVFGGRAFTPSHRSWPGVGGDQRGVRPAFLNVVNAPKLMDFFTGILGGRSATFDHKWLRVVPPGNGNSAHCDIVYMGNGARDLYTVWTPLGDVPLKMGPLAVAVGSHRHQQLQSTYTTIDTHSYLSTGPDFKFAKVAANFLGAQWASSSFAAGDILVFSAYLLHAPLTNTTDKLRLSSDTRYQLASEPLDQRHMGWIPDEFERLQGEKTLEQACREWGLGGMLAPAGQGRSSK